TIADTLIFGNLRWQLDTAKENDGLSSGYDWTSDKLNWNEASDYCDNLILNGISRWRLPSLDELFSLQVLSTDDLSDNISISHSFEAGNTISSSKMNENFQNLVDEINILRNEFSKLNPNIS
ncbi:MAG: DUF1566 domain-containing protein, partial [SAR324 cluster bacterium]|nr:DUF1566 domain-containing protein [SAR324 cluster bacterium]